MQHIPKTPTKKLFEPTFVEEKKKIVYIFTYFFLQDFL